MHYFVAITSPIPLLQPAPKEKEVDTDPSWGEILRRLRRITPHLWPKKSRSLQLVAVCPDSLLTAKILNSFQLLCVLILVVGRFVTVAVPFLFADLVYVFEQGVTSPPWLLLFAYVGLRFLQSSGGLPAVRDVRRTCLLPLSCVFI